MLIAMKGVLVLGHGVEQHDHIQDTHLSRLSLVHPRTTYSWLSSTGERRLSDPKSIPLHLRCVVEPLEPNVLLSQGFVWMP